MSRGFDNVGTSAYLVPSLSTIDPDHDAMAQSAVGLLARRIPSSIKDQEEIVSRFTLVAREPTGRWGQMDRGRVSRPENASRAGDDAPSWYSLGSIQ